jgi:hypothetical protein
MSYGFSFSLRRLLGITKALRTIGRLTGIPMSRSGRQAKFGRMLGMR